MNEPDTEPDTDRDADREPDDAVPADAGFTLVELLVAMGLFAVLGAVLLGFVLSTARVTDEVSNAADLTGEARLGLDRMSRELRQAREIDAATFTTSGVSVTFWTDFDGDGVRDTGLADPEVLTYRWVASTGQLTLSVRDDEGALVTAPVLAATVTTMDMTLRSSLWQHDGSDGTPRDGITTWQELDRAGAPVGNGNGLPDVELEHVDLVRLRIVVADHGASREFVTAADLRNQEQS